MEKLLGYSLPDEPFDIDAALQEAAAQRTYETADLLVDACAEIHRLRAQLARAREHREPLTDALALLRESFPDASLYEARRELRMGERTDHPDILLERSWHKVTWGVTVESESESGTSLEEAVARLRKRIERKALVPGRAERIAAILREVPDEGFARHDVVGAAQAILERERRSQ